MDLDGDVYKCEYEKRGEVLEWWVCRSWLSMGEGMSVGRCVEDVEDGEDGEDVEDALAMIMND